MSVKPATNDQMKEWEPVFTKQLAAAKIEGYQTHHGGARGLALIERIRQEEKACTAWEKATYRTEKARRMEAPEAQRLAEDEIERLRALLNVARCPDEDCDHGAVPVGPDPDGHWDVAQCQWCHEKVAALESPPSEEGD